MAFTLIPEDGTGNPLANSYATMEQAQSYFDARLYSDAWDDADPNDQPKALVMATRLIDANYKFEGSQTYQRQVLAWPRIYCPNREQICSRYYGAVIISGLASFGSYWGAGAYWDATLLPAPLVAACCEMAGELLVKNRTKLAEPAQAGIKSFSIAGELSFVFDSSTQPGVLPPTVDILLSSLGSNRVTSTMRRVGRA